MAGAPASHYLEAGAGVYVCACKGEIVGLSISITLTLARQLPLSVSPCQFLPLLLLCVRWCEGVRAFEGVHDGSESWEKQVRTRQEQG